MTLDEQLAEARAQLDQWERCVARLARKKCKRDGHVGEAERLGFFYCQTCGEQVWPGVTES